MITVDEGPIPLYLEVPSEGRSTLVINPAIEVISIPKKQYLI
jgi:hypothetical protein